MNSWGYSSMGFGVCGVLGAQLAAPDRPCVAVVGDGGFMMAPYVVATAVEYDLPCVWIVWNNFAWGAIRDLQYGLFEGRELGYGLLQGQPGAWRRSLQSGFCGVGEGLRRGRCDRNPQRRFTRRCRGRRQEPSAMRHRRACRLRSAAAIDRDVGVASIPYKEPIFGKPHPRHLSQNKQIEGRRKS